MAKIDSGPLLWLDWIRQVVFKENGRVWQKEEYCFMNNLFSSNMQADDPLMNFHVSELFALSTLFINTRKPDQDLHFMNVSI